MGIMISKNDFDGFVQFKNSKNFTLKTGRKEHLNKHNITTNKLFKTYFKKKKSKKKKLFNL